MHTSIRIDSLRVFARHGVDDQERRVGALFEVSISLDYDFMEAALTDNLDKTVNYAELTAIVVDIMSRPRRLLESVAVDIHHAVMERWPAVSGGSIEITKVHPPIPAPTPRATVALSW